MNIHEYQPRELLAKFGVPVPAGRVDYSADNAVYVATELGVATPGKGGQTTSSGPPSMR